MIASGARQRGAPAVDLGLRTMVLRNSLLRIPTPIARLLPVVRESRPVGHRPDTCPRGRSSAAAAEPRSLPETSETRLFAFRYPYHRTTNWSPGRPMTPAVSCPTRSAPRGHSAARGSASSARGRGRGLVLFGRHRLADAAGTRLGAAGRATRAVGTKGREGKAWDPKGNMTQAGGTDPGP